MTTLRPQKACRTSQIFSIPQHPTRGSYYKPVLPSGNTRLSFAGEGPSSDMAALLVLLLVAASGSATARDLETGEKQAGRPASGRQQSQPFCCQPSLPSLSPGILLAAYGELRHAWMCHNHSRNSVRASSSSVASCGIRCSEQRAAHSMLASSEAAYLSATKRLACPLVPARSHAYATYYTWDWQNQNQHQPRRSVQSLLSCPAALLGLPQTHSWSVIVPSSWRLPALSLVATLPTAS